jgi:hypothetical protein
MTTRGRIVATVGPLLIAGCIMMLGTLPGIVVEAEGNGFDYSKGTAGEIAEAFIETFSTGEDSLMAGFFQSYLSERALEEHSVKTRVWEYQRLFSLFGKFTPHKIIKDEELNLVLQVKSEKLGTWFHLNIEMDEAAPGFLLDVDFQPAARSK